VQQKLLGEMPAGDWQVTAKMAAGPQFSASFATILMEPLDKRPV
jgi:hypothetical protein